MYKETIRVVGRRLSWGRIGSGPPLLLVNGYAATGADWDPDFLAALAEGYEVLCPDSRGMGESDLGSEPLTVDAIAADLRAVLVAAEIEACPVVGWSMGGFAAQRLAETSPEMVSALALLSTDAGGPAAATADPGDWARPTDPSGSPREQASRLISLLFPPPLRRPPTVVLHGAEARVIPAANAEPLAERWGAVRAEVFDGCGHAVMAQQPAAIVSIL